MTRAQTLVNAEQKSSLKEEPKYDSFLKSMRRFHSSQMPGTPPSLGLAEQQIS